MLFKIGLAATLSSTEKLWILLQTAKDTYNIRADNYNICGKGFCSAAERKQIFNEE